MDTSLADYDISNTILLCLGGRRGVTLTCELIHGHPLSHHCEVSGTERLRRWHSVPRQVPSDLWQVIDDWVRNMAHLICRRKEVHVSGQHGAQRLCESSLDKNPLPPFFLRRGCEHRSSTYHFIFKSSILRYILYIYNPLHHCC
jgi:hypothetical protein